MQELWLVGCKTLSFSKASAFSALALALSFFFFFLRLAFNSSQYPLNCGFCSLQNPKHREWHVGHSTRVFPIVVPLARHMAKARVVAKT